MDLEQIRPHLAFNHLVKLPFEGTYIYIIFQDKSQKEVTKQ